VSSFPPSASLTASAKRSVLSVITRCRQGSNG
jgi:hypothetical protein